MSKSKINLVEICLLMSFLFTISSYAMNQAEKKHINIINEVGSSFSVSIFQSERPDDVLKEVFSGLIGKSPYSVNYNRFKGGNCEPALPALLEAILLPCRLHVTISDVMQRRVLDQIELTDEQVRMMAALKITAEAIKILNPNYQTIN